jgi:hypothetical protein
MQSKITTKLLTLIATGLLIPAAVSGVQDAGATFNIARSPENPMEVIIRITDGGEAVVSGVFSINRLQTIRAIMTEAKNFAMNSEAAGTNQPVTTRFFNAQEPGFLVDVMKTGTQSQLFVTIKSEIGRLTVEVGKVNRGYRREEGAFFDVLAKIETMIPKPPNRSPK